MRLRCRRPPHEMDPSMKLENESSKTAILNRLRRIEGQVRGIEEMIRTDRDCTDIVQQFAAVRSATQGAMNAFLEEYAAACLRSSGNTSADEREEMMHNLLALLNKAA